ncbi:hypothetical protein K2173_023236 [Erythroxylum novogranatense]|uniref:LYR motif containing domain-containing protein n=1 Tax=Erythroxylum novogranatense TaxID=1862640 RepID=A0AAV8T8A1_9ROSI|nr:hypothetical protein K2173_023236 [Erythroxylum novogranatense]
MGKGGLIWATAEDLARNRGKVLSLYRQLLLGFAGFWRNCLNSPNLPLNYTVRMAKKAEVRGIFIMTAEERSLHNINDLINTAKYVLSFLRKGQLPPFHVY